MTAKEPVAEVYRRAADLLIQGDRRRSNYDLRVSADTRRGTATGSWSAKG